MAVVTANLMGTVKYATVYVGEADGSVDMRIPNIVAAPVVFDEVTGGPLPQGGAAFSEPQEAAQLALDMANKFEGSIYEVWECRVVAAAVHADHAEAAFTEDQNAEIISVSPSPSVDGD